MKRDSRVCCRRWACSRQLKLRRRGCSLPPRRFRKRPPRLQRPAGLRNCCKPCPAERPNLAVHRLNIRERVKRRLPIGRPNPLRLLPRANREPSRSCSALLKAPGRRRLSRRDREQGLPPPVPPAPLRRCCRWTSNPLLPRLLFPRRPITRSASLPRAAWITAQLPKRQGRLSPAAIHSLPRRCRRRRPAPSPAAGVGITRLIRMLDEPGTQPPPIEAAPAPRSAEPGIWTQTFATLNTPEQPPAPKAPEWAPPPPPVAPRPAFRRKLRRATPSAGPSEFTRILDASRMRELAMKGGQPPSAPPPPQAPPPRSFAPTPRPRFRAISHRPRHPWEGCRAMADFRPHRLRCPLLIP